MSDFDVALEAQLGSTLGIPIARTTGLEGWAVENGQTNHEVQRRDNRIEL